MLKDNKYDILVGDFYLRHDRVQNLDASVPYFISELIFVVPPGYPFTPLESLLKPFKFNVWITLIIVVVTAIVVIVCIKQKPKPEQNFVFGRGVNYPVLNVSAIILGVTQHRLPTRNFARFILMSFIILCLVLRSIYQGFVFEFLQSNMQHEPVQTFEDMVKQDFDFYSFDNFITVLLHEKVLKSNIKVIKSSQAADIWKKLRKPTFKATLMRSALIAKFTNKMNFYNYTFGILKERYFSTYIVLYFKKGSKLKAIFDKKLHQILNAGLIEFWQKEYIEVSRKEVKKGNTPRVLSMKHVIGVFKVWIVGCLMSIVVFLVEYFKRMLKK